MKRPPVVTPTDDVIEVGRAFGTPVVVKGGTWFPLVQLVVWPIMAWLAGREQPDLSWRQRLGIGALSTVVVLGSEWCHNLAHAAAARLVGKPMDALRITWGMLLVVYYDINDTTVTPGQHVLRALGGPLCNALLLLPAGLFRRATRPGSGARHVANTAVATNAFLSTASLLPVPGIDGGPILKWGLVARGHSPREADDLVRETNKVLGGGLGLAAGIAVRSQ